MKSFAHSRIYIALAAGLLSVGVPAVTAAQAGDNAVDKSEAEARQDWRLTMHHASISDVGCFHASYPSTQWEKAACADASSYRSAAPRARAAESTPGAGAQTIGNFYDFVAQAPSGQLVSYALGSFPAETGVTSEKTVNVPFGGGISTGIPGANEYTLQINTNLTYTAACNGYPNCGAWQQYVVATNSAGFLSPGESKNVGLSGTTQVFIEYTLYNYGVTNGSNICPPKFEDDGPTGGGGDYCVQNSAAAIMYDGQIPATQLTSLQLSGSAVLNGLDVATATYDTEAFAVSTKDSHTDIAGVWNQVEFNVFGNQNGSEAVFNKGSALTAQIVLEDGSSTAPTCILPSSYEGSTGETNNLTPGTCTAGGGSAPYIQFTESD